MTPNRENILVLLDRIFSQKNKIAGEIHHDLNKYLESNLEKPLRKTNDEYYLSILEDYNDSISDEEIDLDFDEDFLNQDDV